MIRFRDPPDGLALAAMKIELLYFDGCPSYETFLPRLQDLLAHAGVNASIEQRRVDGQLHPTTPLRAAELVCPSRTLPPLQTRSEGQRGRRREARAIATETKP